jgi:oxygen-independent coproporphyrinogen-3 oxidase
VSLDLTYGLPGQTTRSLRATVEKVIELGPDRVTCFGYAHLPGARPHQQTIGAAELPTDWHRSALFQCVVDAFAAAGYAWIGLDHFVRDNDELAVAQGEQRLRRNLLGYTTLRRTQVIALGVGGVGEVDATLVQNDPTMRDWQALVASGELPVCCGYHLSADDCRRRDAVVHLLCNLELPAALAPADAYDRLRRRAAEGLVEVAVDRIVVTSRGRLLLRELCAELDECGTGERTAWQS